MSRKRYRPEEVIAKLLEAEVLTKGRNWECSTERLHSALGYFPSAPEALGLPARGVAD